MEASGRKLTEGNIPTLEEVTNHEQTQCRLSSDFNSGSSEYEAVVGTH